MKYFILLASAVVSVFFGFALSFFIFSPLFLSIYNNDWGSVLYFLYLVLPSFIIISLGVDIFLVRRVVKNNFQNLGLLFARFIVYFVVMAFFNFMIGVFDSETIMGSFYILVVAVPLFLGNMIYFYFKNRKNSLSLDK